MPPPLSRLERLAERLAEADEKRARLLAERDAAVVAALAEGATWAEVQRAAGLSLRGMQLAIKRHREKG